MQDIPWSEFLDEALDRAGNEDKLIFVFLYSPTCEGSAATNASTYRDASVIKLLGTEVIPLRINRKADEAAEVVARLKHVWTPDFRIIDTDSFDHYRWHGYLPPSDFAAKLLVGLGRAHLHRQNWKAAERYYATVAEHYATSAAAPEALYYAAISQFKLSGERADLEQGWARLTSRYPNSIWRIRQVFGEQ